MKIPEKPANEKTRLAKLRSLAILDTEAEKQFDRLTNLAAKIFDIPIALVSLVDENRQWFKSCQGLSASETPRDISFCGHAILSKEVLVVQDALADPRFADNPLVIDEPKIRFYAGKPLIYDENVHLGTLCLIDRIPRTFTQNDAEILTQLAELVCDAIRHGELALHDDLTGIYNRRGFISNANRTFSLCRRNNIPFTLVYFDLDKFKLINDQHGHAEGDNVLQTFGNAMNFACRESDIVARLAGDEFAMVLNNDIHAQSVEEVLRRINEYIDVSNSNNPYEYKIEFSHGAIKYDKARHSSLKQLMNEADTLMYLNKSQRQES